MKKKVLEFLVKVPVVSNLMMLLFRFRANLFFLIYRNNKQVFYQIYKRNRWGNKESLSGPGSTLEHTANIRKELPRLFSSLNVQSVLDAPCGDYNWFRFVQEELRIQYIGADIVPDLIARNQTAFGRKNVRFVNLDITADALPQVDLWLCRDCLFHLCNKDIANVLTQFKKSNIRYLLTSLHPGCLENTDIQAGSFRLLNLQLEPFDLPEPLLKIKDWIPGQPVCSLTLWDRDMIP